ncbi:unnamed protein product [Closterium sp. NIES-54]
MEFPLDNVALKRQRATYCPARACPAALLLSALLPCLSTALPARALSAAALPCLPAHSACAPCCPQCQHTLLPSTLARPASQRSSAPRSPTRQRAPRPSAPARPAAQRTSVPCCPTTRACPGLAQVLPAAAALGAAALGAAACCCRPRCYRLLLPPAAALGAAATRVRYPALPCPALAPPCPECCYVAIAACATVAAQLLLLAATACHGHYHCPIPGGGASRVCRRKPLLPQQRLPGTHSPQQLREWAVRWGSPGGGGSRSTRTGGVEAHGAVEAAIPVPITSGNPSGGPVVARGATVLPCPVAPSGLLTGLYLPSFAKNLVATSVLQDQRVTVTQPGGKLVAICTDSRIGEHLATFTRRPGPGLNTLTTEIAMVDESGQVAASVEVAASCLCHLLTHQTLLWHHRLGHPSLPHLHGMHSHLLVSGLPRSLPPLPRSLVPPCLPCVEGRQSAAPHSSSFPPTTAPLQTLHMDVWGPAQVLGQGGEHYFLLVVDDYMCYTTVFPLQSKTEVCKRRIGLVMEVARTSILHAAAPHFLWPFAVRYAAEQLNLWPCVSHSETSPTLRWMGEVGDASPFQVLGALLLVRDPPCGKALSPHSLKRLPWLPHRRPELEGPAPSCVSQVDPSPLVEPVKVSSDTFGPAEGRDPTLAATPVAVDSGAAGGDATRGTDSGGAECPLGTGGTGGAGAGGPDHFGPFQCPLPTRTARAGGAGTTGATGGIGGAAAGSPGSRRQEPLSPEWLCEWAVRWGSPGGGAGRVGATGFRGAGPGGASAGVPGVGRAGGTSVRMLCFSSQQWGTL